MRKISMFLLLILVTMSLFSATTGKIAGQVKDENGNPVAFASIIIVELETGARTKEQGQFIIINVPTGTYTVRCQKIGMQSVEMKNVVVNIDETTSLNFNTEKRKIEMDVIKVVEKKTKMVSKTKVGSSTSMSSDKIEDLAIDDVEGLMALSAGAVNTGGEMHVRGGRSNEVSYAIDGMSVSDPVDGGSALSVDPDAIKDIKTYTGGLTAEHGNAQSGFVSIVTKSGSKNYSGKLSLSSDHLINDGSNSDEIKLNFGGPVIPFNEELREKFTFFFNAGGNWHDTRYAKYYDSDVNAELPNVVPNYEPSDPYSERNTVAGFDLDKRNYNLYDFNVKFKYKFDPKRKMTFAIRGQNKDLLPYSHYSKFALENYEHIKIDYQQYVANYDHMLNSSMNLKVKASYYQKKYTNQPNGIEKSDFFSIKHEAVTELEDTNFLNDSIAYFDGDGLYTNGDGVIDASGHDLSDFVYEVPSSGETFSITDDFASPGSYSTTFIEDKTATMSLRSDFEWQINEIHNAKTGFEVIRNDIKKDQLFDPADVNTQIYEEYFITNNIEPYKEVVDSVSGDVIRYYTAEDRLDAHFAASGRRDGYKADPWQMAVYVQDKMEWEGMIINAGFRLDSWYLGDGYDVKNSVTGEYEYNTFEELYDKEFDFFDKFKVMISPRFGVSHPISETDVVRFSYNYQSQLPQMQYIFTTAKEEDASENPGQITVGNPDLKSQITQTYEVGLQHQISENYSMDLVAYYKNIYNYVKEVRVEDETDPSIYWYKYESGDYGSAKGIDFNLTKNLSNYLTGSAAYSLSWANGNNSGVNADTTNIREFPLNWDTRHNFNFNVSFIIGNDEEFYIPFTDLVLPLDDFNANLNFNIASGKPYTQVIDTDAQDTNALNQDHTSNTDLTINKKFTFTENQKIKIYMKISNLFNRENHLSVYPRTGNPFYDGADLDGNNDGYIEPIDQAIHDYSTKNPALVGQERTFDVGITYYW